MFRKTLLFFMCVVISLLLVLALFNFYYYKDHQTDLLPEGHLRAGNNKLQARYFSVPVVVDWNSDGKKDLLVGHNYIDENRIGHGYISFFVNAGTDKSPRFNKGTYLQTCSNECTPLNASAFG